MKKLLLVINPVAGLGRGKSKLFEITDLLTKHGYRVTVLPTLPNGETEKTVAAEAKNYNIAAAVGGDGTLNAAACGILNSGANIPLGYIPLGSTNDFGASLGLTKNIKDACRRIAQREPKPIDVGRFGNRYFIYIACTGLFAGASYMTSQQLKNALGHSAYLLKGFSELPEAQKTKFMIELENETIGGDFLYAGVSNTLRIGGIVSMPRTEVRFDDGLFELTLIKAPRNIIDTTTLVNQLINSKLDSHNFVKRKVKKAVIRCNPQRGWSLDGENGGEHGEIGIEVVSEALRFIY